MAYLRVSIVFTLVLPPYSSPDEEAHFNSAYRLANRIEGYSSQDLENETIYRRAEDINETFENKYTDVFTYEYIGKHFFEKSKNNDIVSVKNNWVVYDFDGVYFMGALGVLAGKALNLGYIQMAYLGRMFNLLFFTACLYFAIKITPVGKNIFMILSFLPIVMHITNSFSRDTFVISLGFLLTAYLLYLLNQKEDYKTWQLILLVAICTLLAPSKCIYSVMCLLILLLDRHKISVLSKVKKDKKLLLKVVTVAVVALTVLIAVVLKTNGYIIGVVLSSFSVDTPLEEMLINTPQATYNIGILLSYPVVALRLILNTIYQNGAYYVKSIAGGVLGYNRIYINDFFIFILLVLVFISTFSSPEDNYVLKKRERISFAAVFGMVSALVVYVAITWTPIVDGTIYGIQGKYFMPAIPLILLAVRNKTFTLGKDIFNGLCFTRAMTSLLVAWNRFCAVIG